MNQKEKLIEILNNMDLLSAPTEHFSGYLADYLLANGAIVLPCKVGDTVYEFDYQHISEPVKCNNCEYYDEYDICSCFSPDRNGLLCSPKCIQIVAIVADFDYIINNFRDFGKTVFLIREDAEKALRERVQNE